MIVVAAAVSGFFAVLVVVVQAAVARMNSRQHGMVDTKIDRLGDDIRGAGVDFRGLRQDVRDLDAKFDTQRVEVTRRHEENLVHLEHHDAQLDRIDGHVADLTRRVTALEPKPTEEP